VDGAVLGAVIIGTYVIQRANSMGLPKDIGNYVAAWSVCSFIWSLIST
jgi:hypothetical protein